MWPECVDRLPRQAPCYLWKTRGYSLWCTLIGTVKVSQGFLEHHTINLNYSGSGAKFQM